MSRHIGVEAGLRSALVTIQNNADNLGADGSVGPPTASTQTTAWAHIESVRGREFVDGEAHQAEHTHLISFPYVSGVTTTDSILWSSRTFEIVELVNVDERNIKLVAMCKEKL